MGTREHRGSPGGAARRWRRAAAFSGLVLVLAVPWWLPAVPAAFVRAYDAVVTPSRGEPPVPAAPEVALEGLAGDVLDAAAVPQATSAYLSGELGSAGPPRRVRVPRLGVDAPVVPISGQSGELTPPDDPLVLGWWQEGRPAGAATGAGVVTGHTVHTGGGALDELGSLRSGDAFTVVTAAGEIDYQVVWQHDFPTATLAARSGELFSQADVHRLLLVTCSGWNGRGYDRSAVALARPVAERPRGAPPEGGAPREVPGSASGVVDLDREDVAVLRGDRRGHP